jgi:hypothetical protein
MTNAKQLIFVYRADRGLFNAVNHTMHRVFSPATYECRLCFFTTSTFGLLKPWKQFLDSRREKKLFYHRKEFEATGLDVDKEPPLILASTHPNSRLCVLLDRSQIESCADLDELIQKLKQALEDLSLSTHHP